MTLTTVLGAATLEPGAETVWRPLVADLAAALEADDVAVSAAVLASLRARCRQLARERPAGIDEVFTGVTSGFADLAAALARASGDEAARARQRLARLETDALVSAGAGYAEGLEDTVDHLRADIDRLRPEDPLTGVMKEREIVRRLGAELDRCRRMDLALGLAQVGVDCLDEVRQRGGPGETGEFLVRVARLLGDSLRRYDAIGRRGEERFLVVLPDVSRRGLQAVMERFRSDLHDECPGTHCSRFSFALAHLDYLDLAADELLTQIDGGLARARTGGDGIAWV